MILLSVLQQISPNEWHRLVDSESALREAFENSTSALALEAVDKKPLYHRSVLNFGLGSYPQDLDRGESLEDVSERKDEN